MHGGLFRLGTRLGRAELLDELGAQRGLLSRGQASPALIVGLLAAPEHHLGGDPAGGVGGGLGGDLHGEEVALALEEDLGDAAGLDTAAAARTDAAGCEAAGAHLGERDVALAAVDEEDARTNGGEGGEGGTALGAVEGKDAGPRGLRGLGGVIVWGAGAGDGVGRRREGGRCGGVGGYERVERAEEGEDLLVLRRA